jgi:hypothetical protein
MQKALIFAIVPGTLSLSPAYAGLTSQLVGASDALGLCLIVGIVLIVMRESHKSLDHKK